MIEGAPLVSVVVVNLNGRRFLDGLMASLEVQDYEPFEIILVDNGSSDDSVDFVRETFPDVKVIALPDNVGFAQGNNVGIDAATGQHIVVLNNDTVVEPPWLRHLVEEAESSSDIGAVCSKVVFARPFLSVETQVPVFTPRDLGISDDGRHLGVFVADDSGFEGCSYDKAFFRSGLFPGEAIDGRQGRWTETRGTLDLPLERTDESATLRLGMTGGPFPGERQVAISIGGEVLDSIPVDEGWTEAVVPVSKAIVQRESFEIINNAGSFVTKDWSIGDRGIFEIDRGQYDTPQDVEAVCGCSVLFSRDALKKAGTFDADYFAYFEDIELSLRLRDHGYRLRYQPASLVRHYHASTTGEWSPDFTFLVTRNRTLMLLRHAKPGIAAAAYLQEIARFARALSSFIRSFLRRPSDHARQELGTRLRVQRSLLRKAPRALLKRAGLLAP
jgi:GT2 family glycosyltransferase